jgi:hypothetical protein
MKKDFMRWTVGLLAGGALVVAGCGSGNESGEGGRDTGAFRTPLQDRQQPPSRDEAQPLAADRPSHPAQADQDAPAGNLPRGGPLGGGTAGPNTAFRYAPTGDVRGLGTGLGTSLADAYQAPEPQGDTATGGAGAAGTSGQGASPAGTAAPAGPMGSEGAGTGGGSGGGGSGGGGSGGE